MRSQKLSIYLLLLAPLATDLVAQNTIKAVIGLNSSQLIEELSQNTRLSLTPIEGSIIPLLNTQPIINQLKSLVDRIKISMKDGY